MYSKETKARIKTNKERRAKVFKDRRLKKIFLHFRNLCAVKKIAFVVPTRNSHSCDSWMLDSVAPKMDFAHQDFNVTFTKVRPQVSENSFPKLKYEAPDFWERVYRDDPNTPEKMQQVTETARKNTKTVIDEINAAMFAQRGMGNK